MRISVQVRFSGLATNVGCSLAHQSASRSIVSMAKNRVKYSKLSADIHQNRLRVAVNVDAVMVLQVSVLRTRANPCY
jgi:hypothetical protein